ncbi:MAG TPA: hypothetical protein VLF40_02720 [Candidatus Saccharimonadales bacterium]|nr:hypothetical protein [Candidatus Saccharimonadales bacterium]
MTVIIILRLWAGGPSTGTVHEGKPIITAKNEAPKEPLAVDTAYFTVTLPPGFTVRRQSDTPDRPIQLELVASNGHQQFAVTVGTLPSGGLEGLGDYNLRVTQTADYEPYRPAGIPIESTAFRNLTGDVGFTDFWPHGSKYAEISLTSDGAATMPELFGTFEQASHNWQWK